MIYEYRTKDLNKCCDCCKEVFEVRQSILDDKLEKCPNCSSPIERIISQGGAFITRGKQMNQFNDVKAAKYWRDNNGIRHRVTSADGSRSSPTVSRQVNASPELIKARKTADAKKTKKRLQRIRHGFIKKD